MLEQLETSLAHFLHEQETTDLFAYLQIPTGASTDLREQALRRRRDWAQAQRNNTKFRRESTWIIKNYRALHEVFVRQPDTYREMMERSAVSTPPGVPQQPSIRDELLRLFDDIDQVDAILALEQPVEPQLHTTSRRIMRSVAVRGIIPDDLLDSLMKTGADEGLSEEQMAFLLQDEERWWARLGGYDVDHEDSTLFELSC